MRQEKKRSLALRQDDLLLSLYSQSFFCVRTLIRHLKKSRRCIFTVCEKARPLLLRNSCLNQNEKGSTSDKYNMIRVKLERDK